MGGLEVALDHRSPRLLHHLDEGPRGFGPEHDARIGLSIRVESSRVLQLFELLLPGLPYFDVSSAIVRDVPLDPNRYAQYTFYVAIYAAIYTTIALLAGLILFEERDVA